VFTDDSPVRDVQLNPHLAVNFATACEDGSIRVCLIGLQRASEILEKCLNFKKMSFLKMLESI